MSSVQFIWPRSPFNKWRSSFTRSDSECFKEKLALVAIWRTVCSKSNIGCCGSLILGRLNNNVFSNMIMFTISNPGVIAFILWKPCSRKWVSGLCKGGLFMIYFCAEKSLVYSLNRLGPTKVDPAELAGHCCCQYFSCTNRWMPTSSVEWLYVSLTF